MCPVNPSGIENVKSNELAVNGRMGNRTRIGLEIREVGSPINQSEPAEPYLAGIKPQNDLNFEDYQSLQPRKLISGRN